MAKRKDSQPGAILQTERQEPDVKLSFNEPYLHKKSAKSTESSSNF
ncbi:hypothetical protein [Limoniibacter endophyticus]|uniref:Uncharacterized protein n=1 Tax=Limoniibacter endophyticus TaxID=1565040 RepID=A0A8J3GGI7_9HYPH|nr:hypothetical protein [Limoniibacter endophyticus]GHC65130.1 hypothetical protein GCM10010136_07660 [Limoniibacter endophyticus]